MHPPSPQAAAASPCEARSYAIAIVNYRSYTDLERCLATIAEREPVIKALPAINEAGARAAADASGARWKAGNPLSLIDGMPIGIKDLLETKDMPKASQQVMSESDCD